MKFRFMGTYTQDRNSITMGKVTFHDRDPAEVDDPALVERLLKNPEFFAVKAHSEPAPEPAKKPAKAKAKK